MIASDLDAGEQPTEKKAKKVAKGTRSWKPAAPLAIKSRDPNYRIKWVHTDAANVLRKKAEGWAMADTGDARHARPGSVESGAGDGGSITEFRDMVLMKMPESMARERDAYYQNRANEQLMGVKDRDKKKIRAATGVLVDGEITIE